MLSVKIISAAVLCILLTGYGQVQVQAGYGETRGELLYSTYCIACHNPKMHQREKKLATDSHSLTAEVARCQRNMGASWDENEIVDVAHYLNAVYYRFPVEEKKELTEQNQSHPAR